MLSNVVYSIVGIAVCIVGFVVGGYALIADPVLVLKSMLLSTTVWDVLSALAPILAPLVSLFLIVIGKIIWNQEKRLRDLERGNTRQSRTLYGDEDDPQQQGLALDIKNLTDRVEDLEESIDDLNDEIRELNSNDD